MLSRSASHFFRLVSSCLRFKENNITLVDENGDGLFTNGDICKTFLAQFSKAYSKLSEIAIETSSTENNSFQVEISLPALLFVIRRMSSSAAGSDGIPGLIYKHCIGSQACLLLTIFQQLLFQGRPSRAWKVAKVFLLYKGKGGKGFASSYCTIICPASRVRYWNVYSSIV